MILITTPTGQIGRQVLPLVVSSGVPVRVIARRPDRLAPEVAARVEVVPGAHDDPDVLDRALTGVETVFWLRPPDPSLAHLDDYVGFTRPAAALFATKGIRRVVGISALGRGTTDSAGLASASWATDDLIAASGVDYQALTLPSFMDNWLRQVAQIREQGFFTDIFDPDHEAPLCAVRDIAATAADLLLDGAWSGVAEHPLLGPEDLSRRRCAEIMSEVLGQPVRYERIGLSDLKRQQLAAGVSEAVAQARCDMLAAKAQGLDNHLQRIRETSSPTTFRQWCQDELMS
ncbi:NmrA family transcriptional regulator [Kineosporia sp. NBRC 101677]|nr:NAD(P)H-binding protein [Kineosporia sp. NBRC 101677]GLY15568.1 NmrA family transcriptional regulator [Kineosporia sp. NBRC 101677]